MEEEKNSTRTNSLQLIDLEEPETSRIYSTMRGCDKYREKPFTHGLMPPAPYQNIKFSRDECKSVILWIQNLARVHGRELGLRGNKQDIQI